MKRQRVMFQRDGPLVKTGGWMTDAYSTDTRVVVPRVPGEVNITTASETLQVWHERLVRQEESHVRKGLGRVEINMSMAETGGFCDRCVLGKAPWNIYTPRSVRSQVFRELIHADINGPSVKSLQGAKCCVCITDGYSKYRRALLMKQNNELSKLLRKFLNEMSTAGHTVKMFRIYGGISDSVETVYDYFCYQSLLRVEHLYIKSGALRNVE